MAPLFFIITFLATFIFVLAYNRRKHIEIDFDRTTIYGWYRERIYSSASFNASSTKEEILAVKQQVKNDLEKNILLYKQLSSKFD